MTTTARRYEGITGVKHRIESSSPEEEEEFARIQARQDAERPHEEDARMLDAQFATDVAKHYKHQYKGIKLDPYRIAKVYEMQGGPREQIMKKCLRFTDKGQTEQQVVNEIRSALNRWQAMIDEDGAA